jgi:hypothetical protein
MRQLNTISRKLAAGKTELEAAAMEDLYGKTKYAYAKRYST